MVCGVEGAKIKDPTNVKKEERKNKNGVKVGCNNLSLCDFLIISEL